jgi:hypothetical protein
MLMAPTRNNPDELASEKELHVRSEGLDQAFVFRRSTGRDRQAIDRLIFEYSGGARIDTITPNSMQIYETCATLQATLVSPDPQTFSFIDLEDAEPDVMMLYGEVIGWKARFRQPARNRTAAAGGAQ